MSSRIVSAAAIAAVAGLAACSASVPEPARSEGSATTSAATGTASATAAPTPDGSPTAVGTRHVALVDRVRTAGEQTFLTVDYVLFLSDGEAEDAAEAHGGEWPPPNDFYIVNHSSRLREFAVRDDTMVRMVMDVTGATCEDLTCPDMPLADWVAAINGPDAAVLLSTPYWLTIADDDTITAIEQQYIP